ncbi:polyprenyl synthetase family protein [Nakamurella deserti]|uniref:polyprenyl synthetase family protein n=1 Tax=Nakamurella deserti TaxID=2164074 RepID=UPI000DBE261D|nr:polyprenyl synthetase family protein [Nakamurella deserti]
MIRPASTRSALPDGDILDAVLRGELRRRRADVAAVDERLLPLIDRLLRFASTGGKRLRPQFLWWGWRAAGGDPDGPRAQAAWASAASLELIQASALVHDDIIDNSDTRRGEPSVHVSVGVNPAILLGDLALAWADDLFTDGAVALGSPAAAFAAWRGMRTEVIAGQLLDLAADGSAADARQVNRYKTAAYTVERPLHLGAALAGGSAELVTALRGYGVHLGQAFQLRDDLLGVFGDSAVTGKPAGDDLVEGKRTLLLATARDRLAGADLAELDAGLGDPARVQRLVALVAASGAPEVIEDEIGRELAAGLASIAEVPEPARTALTELAGMATARTR